MGSLVYRVDLFTTIPNSRADKYPSLQFLVIINPEVGPGNGTDMDVNFQRKYPNWLADEILPLSGMCEQSMVPEINKMSLKMSINTVHGCTVRATSILCMAFSSMRPRIILQPRVQIS